jgi:hypothetical protein
LPLSSSLFALSSNITFCKFTQVLFLPSLSFSYLLVPQPPYPFFRLLNGLSDYPCCFWFLKLDSKLSLNAI